MTFIRIVARPEGEAPEWVRDAWIGLLLPVRDAAPQLVRAAGVLTGPQSWLGYLWSLASGRTFMTKGYLVDAQAAVDCLSHHSPEAAEWWRNTTPDLLREGLCLIFDEEVCEPLGTAATSAK